MPAQIACRMRDSSSFGAIKGPREKRLGWLEGKKERELPCFSVPFSISWDKEIREETSAWPVSCPLHALHGCSSIAARQDAIVSCHASFLARRAQDVVLVTRFFVLFVIEKCLPRRMEGI